MSTQADKIVRVQCCMVLFPAMGDRAGAGRGWRMEEDGEVSWEGVGNRDLDRGSDPVLAVRKEKVTDVAVTNESTPRPPTATFVPLKLRESLPNPPTVFFLGALNSSNRLYSYLLRAFQLSVSTVCNVFLTFTLYVPWCSFTSLPSINTPSSPLFLLVKYCTRR